MEEQLIEGGVRERLVLCGLKELEEHGMSDFSLRRVASMAQVSCAAPYRHFRDKEELIMAIITHVREGWELLVSSIDSVCSEPRERVMRLCVAYLRFWIANGNFRSVLLSGGGELDCGRREQLAMFDRPIQSAVSELCAVSGGDSASLGYSALAIVSGTAALVASGTYEAEQSVRMMESLLASIL